MIVDKKFKSDLPKVIARKRYEACIVFIKMVQTKPLSSKQYSQLRNCVRLLRKGSSPKPTNPTYVRGLKNLFIDFDSYQYKRYKNHTFLFQPL